MVFTSYLHSDKAVRFDMIFMREQEIKDENGLEQQFKIRIVWLVASGDVEKALQLLAKHFDVSVPKLKIGLPKRHRLKTLGCYIPQNETIYLLNSGTLNNPSVILHEFYHHLRTSIDKKHRGTEKYANRFAKGFIAAYQAFSTSILGKAKPPSGNQIEKD